MKKKNPFDRFNITFENGDSNSNIAILNFIDLKKKKS